MVKVNVISVLVILTALLGLSQLSLGDPSSGWYCEEGLEFQCPTGCTKAQTWNQAFVCCAGAEYGPEGAWSSKRCCQYDCLKYTCTGSGCTYVVDKVFQNSDPNHSCNGSTGECTGPPYE